MGRFSRRVRWGVPVGALLVTGSVLAASQMQSAQASPALPARTAAQLIAQAASVNVPALSGTVVESTSLGIPQLPGTQNPTSPMALLTGSHTIQVWFGGPRDYRLELPASMSETDLYRDGDTAWLWQSAQNSVTQFLLPADSTAQAPALLPLTPQQAATDILAAVGPTTIVSTDSNVMIAQQPAYELVLAPKSTESLIGQVRIAIDAHNGLPLRVEVYAENATSPAISVGYTSIAFAAPSPSDLGFTPPVGAHVTQVNLASGGSGTSGRANGGISATGSGWLTVLELPSTALTSTGLTSTGPAPSTGQVSINGGPGEDAAALQALLGSATEVSGAWGSGKLLHTSLVNVLITSNTTYVGAVQPSVLYAAAAQK